MCSRAKVALLILMLLVGRGVSFAGWSIDNYLDFEFPLLGTDNSTTIRTSLSGETPLVIVVWSSDCPLCRQNVVEADRIDLERVGVRLLGINFDPSRWDAQDAIADLGIGFPQLHDPDGLIHDALGIEGEGFTFALIAPEGTVAAVVYDNVPDAGIAIEEALTRRVAMNTEEVVDPSPLPADSAEGVIGKPSPARSDPRSYSGSTTIRPRLHISGNSRVRWQAVGIDDNFVPSTCSCPLGGPHGELLPRMLDLHYRLTLDIKGVVARGVTAGGRLRVSNEDQNILARGPTYFSNEMGSAFVAINRGEWAGRLGFYEIHFSPLTLQRWDFADNPPAAGSGSSGSCSACGGVSRSLSLTALDDLGPEIVFEGTRISGSPTPWLDLVATYARPRREYEFSYMQPELFAYRQDLFAGRAILSGKVAGMGRPELGLSYVSTRDSKSSSPNWPASIFSDPLSFIHVNEVMGVDLKTELPLGFGLNGEYVRSYQRVDSIIARGAGLSDWSAVVQFSHDTELGTHLTAAWLRLGPDFAAAYSALSYQPNKVGLRASAALLRERWGFKLFYKILNWVEPRSDPVDGPDAERVRVEGGLLHLQPTDDLGIDLTLTRIENRDRNKLGDRCDCGERVITVAADQKIARGAALTLEYSKLRADGEQVEGVARGDVGSLYLSVDF